MINNIIIRFISKEINKGKSKKIDKKKKKVLKSKKVLKIQNI